MRPRAPTPTTWLSLPRKHLEIPADPPTLRQIPAAEDIDKCREGANEGR